jgi:hypothetical protein
MKNADKNRDPEAARKRARSDARCALRKLGLLHKLEAVKELDGIGIKDPYSTRILRELAEILG